MSSRITSLLSVLALSTTGILLHSAPAYAQDGLDIIETRCNHDSQDPAQAALRLEWARRCGTTINIGTPGNPDPARSFDVGMLSANGVQLREYSETDEFWGLNSFSGNNGAYINTIFTQRQFAAFPAGITATPDVNGFQKWTKATLLPRPLYPIFGTNPDAAAATPLFPHPKYLLGDFSDCRMYTDRNGAVLANTSTTGFYVNAFCTSSCYTPEQAISFTNGAEKIIDALTAVRRTGLTTVAPGSTLDKIQFQSDDVGSYTRELYDSTHLIFVVRTASGGELRLTDKHPVIVSTGQVVEASTLKPGDRLIKANGSLDPVVSVTRTEHFGKVYNIKPRATSRTANILIAQGYLVGSSRFQNEDADYINRILLARGIPAKVIPQ